MGRVVKYFSQSPIDEALVRTAADYDFKMKERTRKSVMLSIAGVATPYQIIAYLPYNDSHKRQGIVVKLRDTEEGVLMMKGPFKAFKGCLGSYESYVESKTQNADM
jgi:magnesium-transporting ATPase (P-type)